MPFSILKYWYQDMYPAMSFSDIAKAKTKSPKVLSSKDIDNCLSVKDYFCEMCNKKHHAHKFAS